MSTTCKFTIRVGGELISLPTFVDWHEAYGEVLYSFGAAKVYTVLHDGTVETFPEEKTIGIIRLRDTIEINGQEQPKYFIRVGSTYYPLIKQRTVVYKADELYMLSYHNGEQEVHLQEITAFSFSSSVSGDAFLGIVLELLSEDLQPANVEEDDVKGPAPVSSRIKDGIVVGASAVASGLVKTATLTGNAVEYITPQVIHMLGPSTSQPSEVSSNVSRGFQVTKSVSASAAYYSGLVASHVGNTMYSLGSYLAPHVQRKGVHLLQALGFSEDQASNTYTGAMEVASGAFEGVRTLYDAMEESSKLIGSSIASNTVKIVEHKYGPEVGSLTEDGLASAGNAFVVANNLKIFTPKGAVKKTFKETGKGVCMSGREP